MAETRWPRRVSPALPSGTQDAGEGELRLAAEAEASSSESGVPHVRNEAEGNEGNEVTVPVAWLWCIAGSLACWVLVAWAIERVV